MARLAGVSRGTVSYVVNGLADGKVAISPETQARVWEAVEELGYVPDAGAQALRSGATNTIGLIIPDLSNPHFWQNAHGVEQEVRAAGYRLLVSSMDLNADYGEDSFKDLSGRRIDALILMGAIVDQSEAAQETLAHCLRRRLPIVEISDRPVEGHQVDSIVADYREPASQAMAHLIGLGHRRIGLVCGAIPDLIRDRVEPYRESLEAAGVAVDPDLIVDCGPSIEDGYAARATLLALPTGRAQLSRSMTCWRWGFCAASDAGLGFRRIFRWLVLMISPRPAIWCRGSRPQGCGADGA
ncbi:MAG: LacI family DNA-binding transcriptional regulator [Anaerolineales bacterium]|nr:LacI family DNA-binding transcriptional regulator [Anaerolineales bacterium]